MEKHLPAKCREAEKHWQMMNEKIITIGRRLSDWTTAVNIWFSSREKYLSVCSRVRLIWCGWPIDRVCGHQWPQVIFQQNPVAVIAVNSISIEESVLFVIAHSTSTPCIMCIFTLASTLSPANRSTKLRPKMKFYFCATPNRVNKAFAPNGKHKNETDQQQSTRPARSNRFVAFNLCENVKVKSKEQYMWRAHFNANGLC